MSGYLSNLVERTIPSGPRIEPRIRSRFEPAAGPRFEGEMEEWDVEGGERARAEEKKREGDSSQRPANAGSSDNQGALPKAEMPPRRDEFGIERAAIQLEASREEQDRGAPSRSERSSVEPRRPERATEHLVQSVQAPEKGPERGEREKDAPLIKVEERAEGFHPPRAKPSAERITGPEARGRPVIQVTIGRVEVRANLVSQPATRPASAPARKGLSLEEYLRKGAER